MGKSLAALLELAESGPDGALAGMQIDQDTVPALMRRVDAEQRLGERLDIAGPARLSPPP